MNIYIRKSGFTIVELLVVIAVIGILASITIANYTGVQNKARTASALTNAQEVQSKAEVYASDMGNGTFPTNGTAFKNITAAEAVALSPEVKAQLGTTVPSAAAPTALIYQLCTAAGARVGYWDSTNKAVVYLYIGAATSSTTCSAAA